MKISSFIKKFSYTNDFNNYPDAVILIDYFNNIVSWNKKACEIFGYTREEMTGRNIALLFDEESEKIYESAETEKSFVLSSRTAFDKDIFVEISCKDLIEKEKIIITARNVTNNQKVIEKLLIEYEKHSKINDRKNDFITSLSNDFKTPVHSLIGFSQGLLDGICGELNEKQLKYVTIMNKNANNLLDFVTNFLELCRLEKDDIEFETKVFDVVNLTHTICEKIRAQTEKKGINLEVDLEDVIKKNIYFDEHILSKSLQYLLENAVKFTEVGSIRLKALHPDLDLIKNQGVEVPTGATDKSFLLFQVTDTGTGIPEEDINTIFDEYSLKERKTAKKYKGTGLKLALTKKMLNHLGGEIWVESEQGQGSSFSFIIPVERVKNFDKPESFQQTQV